MQLNIRKLKESDWETLCSWWDEWPEWQSPPRDFLPDNGAGGLMVEKDVPIVAGFIYYTNSKGALLEWIVSNPKYKEADRKDAIELLINAAEKVCKANGVEYMFSIGRNKSLINIHKELGWNIDTKPSHELVKNI
jgi:hypothetical protein